MYFDYLSQNAVAFTATVFIFSLLVGSFLNVVIYRLPVMMKHSWELEIAEFQEDEKQFKKLKQQKPFNLIKPDSTCPKCGHKIRAWENIPVISWLGLRGKCSNCKNPISARYPIVELTTGLLVATLAFYFGPTTQFIFASILTFFLVALTGIDLDEMLLPDQLTLPLLWLGLIINLQGVFASPTDALIGAVAGYLSLWSVFWLFKLATGKEGMGYGDFKLMAVFGAWLGWQMLPMIILLSSLVGAIIGIAMIATKKLHAGKPIPFGPYIAVAGWIALIWGQEIINWYLSTLV